MVRLARAEVFDPHEVAIAHVYNRTVRRRFLMSRGHTRWLDQPLYKA